MRYLLLVFMSLTFLSGCTKEQVKDKLCDAGKAAATVLAPMAATELKCSNTDAIKASIEKKLVDLKVCDAKVQSPLGEALCAPVINGLFLGAVSQLPSEWGCTGDGPMAEEAKAKLIAACAKAL